MFTQVLQQIQQYDTIIIHRHAKPDGDAVGSQVGLKHILMENFPDKRVYSVGDPANRYSFIPDSDTADIPDSTYEGALAIILDSGSPALVSDSRYTLAAKRVRMDHHIFAGQFAEVEVIDTSFESCCGMIAAFAQSCALRLNPVAAQALYTGMVTDSGRFRYDSTNARTFQLAAFLMEQQIPLNSIYQQLYADDLAMKQLRAQFTLKIRTTEQRVAYIYTTREETAALAADTFTISRGMVNTMSDISGVDTWVNFTETQEGVLCELRSNRYNINPIAVKYGGGGHQKASGATVRSYAEAMAMLEDLNNLQGDEHVSYN